MDINKKNYKKLSHESICTSIWAIIFYCVRLEPKTSTSTSGSFIPNGENFMQLAKATLLITDAPEAKPDHRVMALVSDGHQLMLKHWPIGVNGILEFFDVNGLLLWSESVFGTTEVQPIQAPGSLPNGVLIYRLMANGEMAVGKVAVLGR